MEHLDWADHGHVGHGGAGDYDHHSLYEDFTRVLDDLAGFGRDSHNLPGDFMQLVEDVLHPFDHGPQHHPPGAIGTPAEHLPQFDLSTPHADIIGHPGNDMPEWHLQHHDDTCAIVSQEFILNALTGQHISEETLRQEAYQHGWYTPGGGTPLEHVADLLALHGVPVEHHYGTTLEQLGDELQTGHEVIVCLNGEDIWSQYHADSNPLSSYPGMPGQQADHAVEVIGLNDSPGHEPLVILNDPGHPDGRGLEVPASQFMQAWSTSDNYMVSTEIPGRVSARAHGIGGYYNADGTYHYDSDNTDRDPQTGAIIRRW
jgi:hypothetical protein